MLLPSIYVTEFTTLVNSYRSPCISHTRVRNAHGVPTSIRVSRKSIHTGKLLKELATGSRASVVFTVGGSWFTSGHAITSHNHHASDFA